jgi:hypothetical protein
MPSTTMRRRLRRRALPSLLAAAVTVTGATALPPSAASAATPRCTVAKLSAELRRPSAGAGQRFLTLELTNASRRACSLFGYPGMLLLGKRNQPLPTNVVRQRARVRTVVLAPGERATTQLRWGAIPGPGEPATGRCEPAPARVEITPPNATAHFVLPWRYGPVCEHGEITVRPMR